MIYLTSDSHWSHHNIIRYCNRPFEDVHHMNKVLTENWNSVVGPEDTVYHLGDVAFAPFKKFLPYLNGKIILIQGNHDRKKILAGCDLEIHRNLDLEYEGYKFNLNHRPVLDIEIHDPFRDSEQYLEIDKNAYDYILVGHVHEKWKYLNKNINVGVDVWDFRPISIDELITFIKTLENNP